MNLKLFQVEVFTGNLLRFIYIPTILLSKERDVLLTCLEKIRLHPQVTLSLFGEEDVQGVHSPT